MRLVKLFALLAVISFSAKAQTRYFQFTFLPATSADWRDTSVIAATSDQVVIDSLLSELNKRLNQRGHIHGKIASGNAGYNTNASHNFLWHFVENEWVIQPYSIEVCDGRAHSDLDLDTT
jgi:hypothetical protein